MRRASRCSVSVWHADAVRSPRGGRTPLARAHARPRARAPARPSARSRQHGLDPASRKRRRRDDGGAYVYFGHSLRLRRQSGHRRAACAYGGHSAARPARSSWGAQSIPNARRRRGNPSEARSSSHDSCSRDRPHRRPLRAACAGRFRARTSIPTIPAAALADLRVGGSGGTYGRPRRRARRGAAAARTCSQALPARRRRLQVGAGVLRATPSRHAARGGVARVVIGSLALREPAPSRHAHRFGPRASRSRSTYGPRRRGRVARMAGSAGRGAASTTCLAIFPRCATCSSPTYRATGC